MKKLIMLSVIFALLAGSVFAQVGLDVIGQAQLLKGNTGKWLDYIDEDGSPVYNSEYLGTGYGISRVRLSGSGQTEDGKIGGWLRYDIVGLWGFAWWQPLKTFKLQIGTNPDGHFGLDGITRWGFYQSSGDAGVVNEKWAFGASFFGGYNLGGLVLYITPSDDFEINIGIPLRNTDSRPVGNGSNYAYENYLRSVIQAKFNIKGVGTAGLTFEGNTMKDKPVFSTPQDDALTGSGVIKGFGTSTNDNPKLYAYFGMSPNENFDLDFGLGYRFGDKYKDENKTDDMAGTVITTEATSTLNSPIAFGVGAGFKAGSFGLKARAQFEMLGSKKYEYSQKTVVSGTTTNQSYSVELKDGHEIIFDVLPYFALNNSMTLYISCGLVLKGADEFATYKVDSDNNVTIKTKSAENEYTAWHLNPYLVMNHGAGAFHAGLRLEGTDNEKEKDAKKNQYIAWSIPIGITISF